MAYKFQLGNAIMDGALEQEGNITIDGGKLTASAGFEGASLTIQNVAVVSNTKALANVISISGAGQIQGDNLNLGGGNATISAAGAIAGTSVSGTTQLASAKLTINGSDVITQAGALQNITSMSGAGGISGSTLFIGGESAVITQDGAIGGTSLSGTTKVESAKLVIDATDVITQARALQNVTSISGAGQIQGNDLNLGGGNATISAAGAVAGTSLSGTTKVESARLDIDGSIIITQGRNLQNVTSISGAGKIEAALLDLNGSTVITQALALQNVTSMSGAGQIQGNNLELGGGKATISAAGAIAGVTVSGTAQLASAKLTINGSDVITQAGALQNLTSMSGAGTVQGAGATFQSVKSSELTDTRLPIVGPLGRFVDNAGFTLATGSGGHVLVLSGTKQFGGIHSELRFGDDKTFLSFLSGNDGGEPDHQLKLGVANNDVELIISGSNNKGVFIAGGDDSNGGVIVTGVNGFGVEDASENLNVTLAPNGSISGSNKLEIGGTVRLDGVADTAVNQATDSIYFLDGDNLVKRDTIVDFVAAIAGAGLSAGSGKLSTQGSSVETQFNTNQALSEGYNIYTGSSNVTVQLEDRPAGGDLTAGDVFIVKQAGAGEVTISSSSPETTIDGQSGSILLESPFAAVSLVFVDYDRGGPKFRIV